MRTPWLALLPCALALPLAACGSLGVEDDAAQIGVVAELESQPDVTIDDEGGTSVRVFVNLDHMGGPTAETLEVVSASLRLDLEHYADIELAIPTDHPPFAGLSAGESLDFELRGTIPDNHDDWGLCSDPQSEEADGDRVSLDLVLRVTPGANDDADEFDLGPTAVVLHCSHTG
ncbi:MAG: hypothetical protein HC927_08955 [Deltaproteobacteria bacterium]|nr:hypothetical protein [Deltaproteobacteria bacterium]